MKKSERTRQNIAVESLTLYGANGYSRTTLDEVACKCGIAPRTLYLHFRTKEETVDYWLVDNYARLVEPSLDAVMAKARVRPSPFEGICDALLRLTASQDNAHHALVDRLHSTNPSLKAHRQACALEIERSIFAALSKHWPAAGEREKLRMIAMIVMGSIGRAGERWREGGYAGDLCAFQRDQFKLVAKLLSQQSLV